MKWTDEATAAIKKVPFFVRKRVKTRVEKEAMERGRPHVALSDVEQTKARYLSNMESEIKGYRVDACFGASGCPNRCTDSNSLKSRIIDFMKKENMLGFLKSRVKGPLKFHHEFTITIADCPNACSQPQIRDVGIIGAAVPSITDEECSQCGNCENICEEDAVRVDSDAGGPVMEMERCILCGQCIRECPTGTLVESVSGYKVLLGGKLGRHPRLARELPGIFSEDDVMEILAACIELYRQKSKNGERFAAILSPSDFDELAGRFCR